jgi:hypothetical protein
MAPLDIFSLRMAQYASACRQTVVHIDVDTKYIIFNNSKNSALWK